MADISAQDVASLRKATGAGMMDCKQALVSSEGDLDAAMDWLRAKGLGKAGKLGEREATEGAVEALVDGNVGVIVEINCNTDFVAKGADFTGTVAALAKLVAANGEHDIASLAFEGSTVGETLQQLAAKLGENVALGRVVRFETGADGVLDAYKHIQNDRGTIGVLVELGGVDSATPTGRRPRRRSRTRSRSTCRSRHPATSPVRKCPWPSSIESARSSRRRAGTRACPKPSCRARCRAGSTRSTKTSCSSSSLR